MPSRPWIVSPVRGTRTARGGRSRPGSPPSPQPESPGKPDAPQDPETRPGSDEFRADLSGFQQVPPVLTPASGSFHARILEGDGAIEYELSFQGLSTPAIAAHIHFGHPTDNGDIIAFLCGGDDKPQCPGQEGIVRGTILPENIQAIPAQGLAAGDMAGALAILRAGLAYVNVHTTQFPDGEIRGQLRSSRER